MTTNNKGLGIAPFGTVPFGFGDPAKANTNTGKAYSNEKGVQLSNFGGRKINVLTKDYEFDEHGRALGMDNIQQMVYLALVTIRNSSTVLGLGEDFSQIKIITQNIKALIEDKVNLALQTLIKQNLVELQEVIVRRNEQNAIQINIKWIDLTKKIAITTKI